MLILERLSVDYRKRSTVTFDIFPFNDSTCNKSNCVVEAYNSMFSTHWLLDYAEYSVVLDNRQIYNLCKTQLSKDDWKNISYDDMNQLMCTIESAFTLDLRFDHSRFGTDIDSRICNVSRSFPRLHFITSSMSPITSHIVLPEYESTLLVDGFMRQYSFMYKLNLYQDIFNLMYKHYGVDDTQTYNLIEMAFNSNNFFVEINDFDSEEDKVMSVDTLFVGDRFDKSYGRKEIYVSLDLIKERKKVSFVDWCPTGHGFKIDIRNYKNTKKILNEKNNDTIVTFQNNSAISRFFQDRICRKVDLMYKQRAFVHWYVNEGMEEGEFSEAREDLGLRKRECRL